MEVCQKTITTTNENSVLHGYTHYSTLGTEMLLRFLFLFSNLEINSNRDNYIMKIKIPYNDSFKKYDTALDRFSAIL